MLRIALCDDDVNFAGKFEDILDEIKKREHINLDIEVYLDGRELVVDICEKGRKYDLIFLDIEMRGMDGLTAAKEIRKIDELTMLIYVTNHESYALEAYDVQPYQFLVKPISFEIVHQYFMKAYDKLTKGPYYFFCQFGGNTYNLRINEIMYFKSKKRVIWIYMVDGDVYKFYGKMNVLEEQLKQEKADFWRIHQSHLVNVRYIRSITYDQIILKNGKSLSISEDRRKKIAEKYCNYVKESIIE